MLAVLGRGWLLLAFGSAAVLASLPAAYQKAQPSAIQMSVSDFVAAKKQPLSVRFIYSVPMTNCWLQWSTNLIVWDVSGFPLAGPHAITNLNSWNDAVASDFGVETNRDGTLSWVLSNYARLPQCFFRVKGDPIP